MLRPTFSISGGAPSLRRIRVYRWSLAVGVTTSYAIIGLVGYFAHVLGESAARGSVLSLLEPNIQLLVCFAGRGLALLAATSVSDLFVVSPLENKGLMAQCSATLEGRAYYQAVVCQGRSFLEGERKALVVHLSAGPDTRSKPGASCSLGVSL